MIYQAKVKFHNYDHFDFMRSQDSSNYKLGEQYQLYITIDRHYISFLNNLENPLCRIRIKLIDFLTNKGSNPDKQISLYYIPPVKKTISQSQLKLATINSSLVAISEIKQAIDKNRKYKSSLAFIPSKVKHISILSGQSPTQKFRGFLNLAGVMFLTLNIRNIFQNFLRYGILFGQTPTEFVPISFIIAMLMLMIFPLMSFSIHKLKFKNVFSPAIAKFFNILNMALLLTLNILYCLTYKPSPIPGIAHTSITMVILLKLVSYYQINSQLYGITRALQKRAITQSQKSIQQQLFVNYGISEQNLNQIHKCKGHSQDLINLKKLFYFLAIPTLCYQLSYPQTTSIRKVWVTKRIVQLFILIGFQLILIFQYIQPELRQLLKAVHSPQSTWFELFNRHLRVAIPNTLMWITGFYTVFHVWFNIVSELTYFGDRNFYRDWWNCRSIEEYWKTWNLPVHFWFIRHLYNPLLQKGQSKLTANLMVFFISAIAHEYIVSVPLGFLSYWAFLAMMMQAPVIFVQKKLDKILRIQNSELSNVSFWFFFCIIGQPLVVFIYYSMYIDFTNNASDPKIKGFIPLEL